MNPSRPPVRIRVPEPPEIVAWLKRQRVRLRAYASDPERRALWGVVLLAAALRLFYLDLTRFRAEDARQLLLGLDVLHGKLTFAGLQVGAGLYNPPLMNYVVALPLLLGRDPRYASALLALLNVGAVRSLLRAGAAALYPAHSSHRRRAVRGQPLGGALFAPGSARAHLGAFGDAAALCHLFGVTRPQPLGMDAVGHYLGADDLCRLPAAALAPVIALLILCYWRRVSWPHLLLGCALALIIALPYLWDQNLQRLQGIRAVVADFRQRFSGGSRLQTLQLAGWFFTGRHLGDLAGAAAGAISPIASVVAALGSVPMRWRSWYRCALRR